MSNRTTPNPVAIVGGVVVKRDGILQGGTVLIEDGLIVFVGPGKDAKPEPNSTVIRAEGKFVMPGCIDIHVHGSHGDDVMNNGPEGIMHCPLKRDNWNRMVWGPHRFGDIVPGVFTPVLAKHSKSFSLVDCLSVGVDRMQRNFEPMRKQVESWQRSELTDVTAKVVIYEAFVEGTLEAPKHLAHSVHDLYFEPKYEEFRPRTICRIFSATP